MSKDNTKIVETFDKNGVKMHRLEDGRVIQDKGFAFAPKDNIVEEIIDEFRQSLTNSELRRLEQALTTYGEQVRREERYNFKAKIEEANLDKEVGERTGDATAVYEVQNVIRKIKALSEDKA